MTERTSEIAPAKENGWGNLAGIIEKSGFHQTVNLHNTPLLYQIWIILLSRKHYGFVKRLFELEIPEINDGIILVYSVAREAGVRTKIAVYSENERVDAVGSCIGERGSRINRIIEELNGEKVDIVEYTKDSAKFIENALSPAHDLHVFITDEDKKEAMVIVNDENLSLAIGRKGLNVRLASRLTHYKIDVKTIEEARESGINIVE